MEEILILGIGVSVHKTDGVLRFERFCKAHKLPYKIVGEGKVWYGGDMAAGAGGGQKINEILEVIKTLDNKLIVMCDTFDLFPVAGAEEIIHKFKILTKPGQILFTSEVFCWPDSSLANVHPTTQIEDNYGVKMINKYRFLNSGGIIGYRDDIYKLITGDNCNGNGNSDVGDIGNVVKNNDDDQLFFTLKYLDMLGLDQNKIVLDTHCHMFQAVNGCADDLVIHRNRIYNKYTNSYPIFIHGNGPAKSHLNNYENYLVPSLSRDNSAVSHDVIKKIFIALYIDSTEPSYIDFLYHVSKLTYPNKTIYIYDRAESELDEEIEGLSDYVYKPNTNGYVFSDFLESNCNYYFLLEEKCLITKMDILEELVSYLNSNDNYRVIAPMLVGKSNRIGSNFWGALDGNGFYRRSADYLDIVGYNRRGIWNVPYITGAILFSKDLIANWDLLKMNKYSSHCDMSICYNMRRETLFMYVTNNHSYGYVI